MSADMRVQAVELVRQGIARFGDPASGKVNFPGFLRLLQIPPWRELLPGHVRRQLPFTIAKHCHTEVKSLANVPHETFLNEAQHLFGKLDKDSSGTIDAEELVQLLQK